VVRDLYADAAAITAAQIVAPRPVSARKSLAIAA
jgi:hypothetical protein